MSFDENSSSRYEFLTRLYDEEISDCFRISLFVLIKPQGI